MIIVLSLWVWGQFVSQVSITKIGQNWVKPNSIGFCFPLQDFSEPSYANEHVRPPRLVFVCSIFQFISPGNHFYNYPQGITLGNSGLKWHSRPTGQFLSSSVIWTIENEDFTSVIINWKTNSNWPAQKESPLGNSCVWCQLIPAVSESKQHKLWMSLIICCANNSSRMCYSSHGFDKHFDALNFHNHLALISYFQTEKL